MSIEDDVFAMWTDEFRADLAEFSAAFYMDAENDERHRELMDAICEKYGVDDEFVLSQMMVMLGF